MRFPGFIGPSYQLRSINVDCQRCINMYPEFDEMKTAKEASIGSLIGTPGLSSPFVTLGTSPHRGAYLASNGVLYVCAGNKLYTVSSAGVATTIGTINTSSGPVSMADNGVWGSSSANLFLVDGLNGFVSVLGSTSLAQVTDTGFTGNGPADIVSFQDGYFIFNRHGTSQFFTSDFGKSTFTQDTGQVGIGQKETNPDNIVGLISDHRNLWLFGNQTTEAWYNAGNSPGTPFSLIQGGYSEVGCGAAFSIQKLANTVLFVGQDKSGLGVVYMMNGYQPQRVSTHAVELAIQSYGDISTTTSWTYQDGGHQFYCLNFPNATSTWVFDVTTMLWHERCYLNQGLLQRALPQTHVYAFGMHLVGDYQSGNLYQMSSSIYSDNGNPIPSERTFPHLASDMDRIRYTSLQLDMEPGVGVDGGGQGTNPQAMMQFSNDGGHTWSSEYWTSMGAIGQTRSRAIWRRLGMARDRVFKIRITDPVKRVWIGAEIYLQKEAS